MGGTSLEKTLIDESFWIWTVQQVLSMASKKPLPTMAISDAPATIPCFALTSSEIAKVPCFGQAMFTARIVGKSWRLALFVLAYNLGNFLRRLVLPRRIKYWSLRSLLTKLIKIGAKVVRHGRMGTFQMAEVAVSKEIRAEMLSRIDRLRWLTV